jgi:hypothetical protein
MLVLHHILKVADEFCRSHIVGGGGNGRLVHMKSYAKAGANIIEIDVGGWLRKARELLLSSAYIWQAINYIGCSFSTI